MYFKRLLVFLVIILAAPLAWAGEAYFNAESIPPALLTPPHSDKSAERQRDIDYILKLQKNADPAELAKAAAERNMSPEMVAVAVMPDLKRDAFPMLYILLDRVGATSRGITDKAKKFWRTDRPYLVDKRVKPLIEAHSNNSYPSGHTAGSYSWAYVLAMLLPENGQEFYSRAKDIAEHRALVGMHFPHDLDGGRQLALLTIGGLLQNAQFLADLENARVELKAKQVAD